MTTFSNPNFGPEDEAILKSLIEGPVVEAPPTALKARVCRCESPWTEYEPDLGRRCIRCGCGVKP